MITVKINQKKELIEPQTIFSLLQSKKINENAIILLLNEKVIKKKEFTNIIIKENDEIELINFFVGG